MPPISVPAVFDGEHIQWLGPVPVQGPYRVLVTFVEPTTGATTEASATARFWASFGAWQETEPAEVTIAAIHAARRSRSEPPPL